MSLQKKGNILSTLEGRVVFVTGAAGQLGSEIVNQLLASGARVVATDSNFEMLEVVCKDLCWSSEQVVIAPCDISKKSDVNLVFNFGVERFGQITDLIANAGVSVFEPYLERSEDSVDFVMDVNLKGTLFTIQEFIKHRKRFGGGGSIVNVASMYGVVSPDPRIYTDCLRKNSEIYGATKAGVIQITKYFAVHAAEYKIRVNSISPGGILGDPGAQGPDFKKKYSERCPIGRMAFVAEIAAPALFLISDAATYINGHNLIVDGGVTCW